MSLVTSIIFRNKYEFIRYMTVFLTGGVIRSSPVTIVLSKRRITHSTKRLRRGRFTFILLPVYEAR